MRLIACLLLLLLPRATFAAPAVAVDIAPVHSLVAQLMAGAGTPDLILPPSADPHHYAMRPSQARSLQQADLVIWIGPTLTPWMTKAMDALAPEAATVQLLVTDHDDDAENHAHDEEDGHVHGPVDPHIWLDPFFAAVMLPRVAEALTQVDPDNASLYATNLKTALAQQSDRAARLAQTLAPLKDRGYLSAHDSLGYLEQAYGLTRLGSLSDTQARKPGASHLRALRDIIASGQVACVFSEPEANAALLEVLVEGSTVPVQSLDVTGMELEPGPQLYDALMSGLAREMAACLSQ